MLPLVTGSQILEPFRNFWTDLSALDPVLLQLAAFAVLLGGVYALAALGLTMIFGVMDVINFAHGMFLVVGMYTAWLVSSNLGFPDYVGLPIAIIAATALMFAVGWILSVLTIEPIIEAPEENQFIVTLGISFILLAALRLRFSTQSRQINLQFGELQIGGTFIPWAQLAAVGIAVAAIVAVYLFLQYTKRGRAIRATADNRDGAWYMGIDVPRVDHLTFGLGAALAGLAGASIALFSPFSPSAGDVYLVRAFIIVVLGGLGSFPGALVGGLVIGFIEVFGGYYLPGTFGDVVVFALFVGLLYVKPTGLFGTEAER
ncbi:branched-chain amino acid ABC transporter permease [Halorubellus sp. JP-L1]|uniref:branched-chain amino acid ABC transporter permease n=1 Tax=Halorubellus sp. JP-L1 TaxID=2715753 RepID=UPI0014075B6E|nr:branched-chain amino acid ABC transporter permease [Halorubellus sp. JP-L1]NHN42846.1 branched-chain amino acid ABC transporter permease [Halorubellus sp. JP-L1]